MTARRTVPALAVALLLGAAACGGDGAGAAPVVDVGDGGDYRPSLDPADVVDGVDHPYLPFTDGSSWVYEGESDGEVERIEVTVLPERREVMGIAAVVVRDTVTIGGELFEDTYDWYAQDRAGNVWYLGEETAEYEGGEVVSTDGSWEAGVDGALPGIVMPAEPVPGHAYRQELWEGEAEDVAEILRVGGSLAVRYGRFADVLTTREWNPLEPEVVEEKHYAPGVGLVLEEKVEGGDGRVELVEHRPG